MTDSGIYVLLASPDHKKSLCSLNRSLQSDENHFPFFFLFSLSLFFLHWSIKRPFAFLQSGFLWSWKSILQEDMGSLKLPPHPSEILVLIVDFTWLIHHNICLWNIFLKWNVCNNLFQCTVIRILFPYAEYYHMLSANKSWPSKLLYMFDQWQLSALPALSVSAVFVVSFPVLSLSAIFFVFFFFLRLTKKVIVIDLLQRNKDLYSGY